jgi:hypothetical protein
LHCIRISSSNGIHVLYLISHIIFQRYLPIALQSYIISQRHSAKIFRVKCHFRYL